MKSCGVIVEYNPFHNGHKYHLEEARRQTSADVVIAVMSGNFLQRGEPALLDKWTRAKQALLNGADMVIELPFAYAVQSADYFAKGGVTLLHAFGCESLCFGTDSETFIDYQLFGQNHVDNEEIINQRFQDMSIESYSYPQKMTMIYRELFPELRLDYTSPNHILGMAYAKENARYKEPMTLYPIKRKGNGYHDQDISVTSFASATSIRKAVLSKELMSLEHVIPDITYQDLEQLKAVSWSDAWPFLQYRLQIASLSELSTTYQMVEGLEYRLKEALSGADEITQFIENVKTKRYTWARIQRLCTYALLKVKQKEIDAVWEQPYIRILGFNETGRRYLKENKKACSMPIITNINQKNEPLVSLDIKAGQLYQMLNHTQEAQDYFKKPIYLRSE